MLRGAVLIPRAASSHLNQVPPPIFQALRLDDEGPFQLRFGEGHG